jgi:hypothetical protein
VLGVVLPSTLPTLPSINVAVEIVVLVEIIVVVDVDVAATPVAVAPIATPSSPGGRTQRNACAPH